MTVLVPNREMAVAGAAGVFSSEPKNKRRKVAASERGAGAADWSAIPGDILCLVAEKIKLIEDYVRFCAVCRHWYSLATDYYINVRKQKSDFAPITMLREDDAYVSSNRTFFSNASGNWIVLDLPEATGRRCWGSPFGWIITYGPTDLEFSVVNPFSRATVPLPSLRTLVAAVDEFDPSQGLIKAFLTASPDSPDCLVLVAICVYEGDFVLGFAKPGRDEAWSLIEGDSDLNDIVYFKGNLYGIRRDGMEVVLIELEPPRTIEFAAPLLRDGDGTFIADEMGFGSDGTEYPCTKYLVDLGGELGMILRYILESDNHTVYFKIFKMNMSTRIWTRVRRLEDCCLFIGNNYSFTWKGIAPPVHITKVRDHRRDYTNNFIYYTHDHDCHPVRDEGIYDSNFCYQVYRNRDSPNTNPPLWFKPSLHFRRLEEFRRPRRCSNWVRRCSSELAQPLTNEDIKNDMKDLEKEEKNQIECKDSEPCFPLKWGKRKRLSYSGTYLESQRKNGQVSNCSKLEVGGTKSLKWGKRKKLPFLGTYLESQRKNGQSF